MREFIVLLLASFISNHAVKSGTWSFSPLEQSMLEQMGTKISPSTIWMLTYSFHLLCPRSENYNAKCKPFYCTEWRWVKRRGDLRACWVSTPVPSFKCSMLWYLSLSSTTRVCVLCCIWMSKHPNLIQIKFICNPSNIAFLLFLLSWLEFFSVVQAGYDYASLKIRGWIFFFFYFLYFIWWLFCIGSCYNLECCPCLEMVLLQTWFSIVDRWSWWGCYLSADQLYIRGKNVL